MTMGEMHENRGAYVARVKEQAQEDLEKNGLELESVAIIDIDQTALEYFNPSNRFDAEGLTSLIKDIEDRRKLRNDIEQDSMIKIRSRNLEAEKQALEIERESEEARLSQERDVEPAAPSSAPNWPANVPSARPRRNRPRSPPGSDREGPDIQ
jgi:uncharacterized membrane protein YqiK